MAKLFILIRGVKNTGVKIVFLVEILTEHYLKF